MMPQADAGPTPQALPAPPTPPGAPSQIIIPGDYVLPTTRAELEALRRTRDELSRQLMNVAGRREEIAGQLATAAPEAKAGLQQRLETLDAGILQLERDLATTRRFVTVAEANLGSTGMQAAGPFGTLDSDQITGITIVFTIFVLFPIAIALARLLWKKATSAPVPRNRDDSERLERVEQAVETIAIEVERISEGQRFVTKLLAQPNGVPVTATQRPGEPVNASRSSASGSGERR